MCAQSAPFPLEIRLPFDLTALNVQARFRGNLIASRCLRPGRKKKSGRFVIGSAKGVDAPAAEATLGTSEHTLVCSDEGGFAVSVAEGMTGRMLLPDRTLTIGELASEGSTTAPAAATLELICGEVAFSISAATPPEVLPRPPVFRPQTHGPGAIALGTTLLLLALLAFIPRDSKVLSFDHLIATHRFLRTTILAEKAPPPQSALGSLAALVLDAPAATAPRKVRRTGPPSVAAPPRGKTAAALGGGILGVLAGTEGQSWRSVFAADSPLSATAETALRGLQAIDVADAAGRDGLGFGPGPGDRAEGNGLSGVGAGLLPRGIGDCDARCQEARRLGPRTGMASRHTVAPDVVVSAPIVRGVLDRELVRRVIRRHLNEVRYCYERALPRHPELSGRVVVTFTIATQGRVMAAAKDSSTMNDAEVESCVVQAVRRWEFPQPKDNGVVIVSYPFVFVPAGS